MSNDCLHLRFRVCAGKETWCRLCVRQASNSVLSPFIISVPLTSGLYFLLFFFSERQLLDLSGRLTDLVSSNSCFHSSIPRLTRSLRFAPLAGTACIGIVIPSSFHDGSVRSWNRRWSQRHSFGTYRWDLGTGCLGFEPAPATRCLFDLGKGHCFSLCG